MSDPGKYKAKSMLSLQQQQQYACQWTAFVLLVYLDNSLNKQALLVCPAMSGHMQIRLSVTVLSCKRLQFQSTRYGSDHRMPPLYSIFRATAQLGRAENDAHDNNGPSKLRGNRRPRTWLWRRGGRRRTWHWRRPSSTPKVKVRSVPCYIWTDNVRSCIFSRPCCLALWLLF